MLGCVLVELISISLLAGFKKAVLECQLEVIHN